MARLLLIVVVLGLLALREAIATHYQSAFGIAVALPPPIA